MSNVRYISSEYGRLDVYPTNATGPLPRIDTLPKSAGWFIRATYIFANSGGVPRRFQVNTHTEDTLPGETRLYLDSVSQSYSDMRIHYERNLVAFTRVPSGNNLVVWNADGGTPILNISGVYFWSVCFYNNLVAVYRDAGGAANTTGYYTVYDLDTLTQVYDTTIPITVRGTGRDLMHVIRGGIVMHWLRVSVTGTGRVFMYDLNTGALSYSGTISTPSTGTVVKILPYPNGTYLMLFSEGVLQRRDQSHNIVWQVNLPGETGTPSTSSNICLDYDENIYIAGFAWSGNMLGITKLNPAGDILWNDSTPGRCSSISVSTNNRLVVYSNSLNRVLTYDFDGNQISLGNIYSNALIVEAHPGRYALLG